MSRNNIGTVQEQEQRLATLEVLRQHRLLTPDELAERDRLETRRDNRATLARRRIRQQLDAAIRKVDRLRRRAADLRIEGP